ncbi:LPS export ABC transporter periplasmic protein LptC [Escherichia coli]|nr:LPS export ABC transporter periplasmic protein LptC [Escherichia coli]KYV39241.1 LPS export ABC transporter periplasmic protein LptC [Escherichia coli]
MSKARRWVIIVLSLAVLVMIGINMAEKDDTAQVVVNNNDPTYKSEHTDTLVYNPEGALSYRLDDTAQVVVNNNDPTYKSEHTDTLVYNPEGALSYRLIAQHVEYYSDQAVSWFTQPVLTTFDKDKIPTWSVKADKAKLTNDRMLYLYGHVEVNALVPDSQLRRITTDNAQINLVTQDVTSEDLVTLYGTTFNSSGLKMRGNLRSKNAELIEKVRTSYEIQNKQTQP